MNNGVNTPGTPIATVEQMESLQIADVTRIATEAALELSPKLEVVGVTFSSGDGDYTEIVVDVTGCHREPCRVSLGVFRNTSEVELHNEITDKLERHFKTQL